MMHYRFSFPNRVSRFAVIEFHVDGLSGDDLEVRLPAWRPGRYELGNFAKNIRSWKATDDKGNPLSYMKTGKDSWRIELDGATSVIVKYDYYCSQPDAGACWIDESLIYINPVHCCLYVPEQISRQCTVELLLPEEYTVACSMAFDGKGRLTASDYHELVDSPWMASAELIHDTYRVAETDFHLWFHGAVQPDLQRITSDFRKFTEVQIRTMGDIPVRAYHFLVLALPYPFYHGVEHLRSTVLAIGPAGSLMDPPLYDELTGVASHELFHVWNIKSLRPAEMLPYDYTSENYSRLGFVYEGVTTYYGDLFLARAGVYSHEKFLAEIGVRLQRHFDSHARFHQPVAEASFDTWLDGYVPGIPHRKTSIYDEGSLVALMTDLLIRRSTGHKASLDHVMRILYEDFAKKRIGYTEGDYIMVTEGVAGIPVADFFADFVYGTENYETLLKELLQEVGCELVRSPSSVPCERRFGFRVTESSGTTVVKAVLPGSVADRAGLGKDDEVIAVNGRKVEGNLDILMEGEEVTEFHISVMTPMKRMKDVVLVSEPVSYYHRYSVKTMEGASADLEAARHKWLNG
ncbi:MAG: hypothetical protein RL213_1893 [Bacteroidota bacterium]